MFIPKKKGDHQDRPYEEGRACTRSNVVDFIISWESPGLAGHPQGGAPTAYG